MKAASPLVVARLMVLHHGALQNQCSWTAPYDGSDLRLAIYSGEACM